MPNEKYTHHSIPLPEQSSNPEQKKALEELTDAIKKMLDDNQVILECQLPFTEQTTYILDQYLDAATIARLLGHNVRLWQAMAEEATQNMLSLHGTNPSYLPSIFEGWGNYLYDCGEHERAAVEGYLRNLELMTQSQHQHQYHLSRLANRYYKDGHIELGNETVSLMNVPSGPYAYMVGLQEYYFETGQEQKGLAILKQTQKQISECEEILMIDPDNSVYTSLENLRVLQLQLENHILSHAIRTKNHKLYQHTIMRFKKEDRMDQLMPMLSRSIARGTGLDALLVADRIAKQLEYEHETQDTFNELLDHQTLALLQCQLDPRLKEVGEKLQYHNVSGEHVDEHIPEIFPQDKSMVAHYLLRFGLTHQLDLLDEAVKYLSEKVMSNKSQVSGVSVYTEQLVSDFQVFKQWALLFHDFDANIDNLGQGVGSLSLGRISNFVVDWILQPVAYRPFTHQQLFKLYHKLVDLEKKQETFLGTADFRASMAQQLGVRHDWQGVQFLVEHPTTLFLRQKLEIGRSVARHHATGKPFQIKP